jgi:hypothetical protein
MDNEWYDEAPLIEAGLLPINVSPAEEEDASGR